MRFDTKIYFLSEPEKTYDEATGDYSVSEPEKTEAYADITTPGAETSKIYFGDITEDGLTVRTREYSEAQRMEINGNIYRIIFRRRLRGKTAYIVREVH